MASQRRGAVSSLTLHRTGNKVHRYSVEFKLTAVKLSGMPGVQVRNQCLRNRGKIPDVSTPSGGTMRILSYVAVVFVSLMLCEPDFGQAQSTDQLGKVDFHNSCSPAGLKQWDEVAAEFLEWLLAR